MIIKNAVSLKEYNTFGLEAHCQQLLLIQSKDDLSIHHDLFSRALILGGGSNVLLSQPHYDTVAINQIDDISICKEGTDHAIVAIGSGKNWHETVLWSIDHQLGGIENLSLIPGTVGAGPIQNIGAYGCELKDVLIGVDFYDFSLKSWRYLGVKDCEMGYRDSIFKREFKNKGFIGMVYLRLNKANYHTVNTNYAALKTLLQQKNISSPTIQQVSDTVIEVRNSKLPDWKQLGNAGSFFKNPIISKGLFKKIQAKHSQIPSYPVDLHNVKVPAAWLIQEAGFKGKKIGGVGCYQFQPLVIVNYGEGTAAEILHLKDTIQQEVFQRFQIHLSPEVSIL